MTSTKESFQKTYLPVEVEINIFRNMNTMRDIINYASTNKYRKKILKNYLKSILLNNKKLQENDFISWYRVLTRYIDINIEDKNKYLLEFLNKLRILAVSFAKTFGQYELRDQRKRLNPKDIDVFFKKFQSAKPLYKKLTKDINTLLKKPLYDLQFVIQQSKNSICMDIQKVSDYIDKKLSLHYRDFYLMYFLNGTYEDIIEANQMMETIEYIEETPFHEKYIEPLVRLSESERPKYICMKDLKQFNTL